MQPADTHTRLMLLVEGLATFKVRGGPRVSPVGPPGAAATAVATRAAGALPRPDVPYLGYGYTYTYTCTLIPGPPCFAGA